MCLSKVSLGASQLLLALATFQGLALGQLDQNLEDFWAYGRSPPVYPSRTHSIWSRFCYAYNTDFIIAIGAGTGDWAAAYAQARAIVAQATNEEKQNVSIGYYGASNGCSGVYQTRVIMLSRPYSYCN